MPVTSSAAFCRERGSRTRTTTSAGSSADGALSSPRRRRRRRRRRCPSSPASSVSSSDASAPLDRSEPERSDRSDRPRAAALGPLLAVGLGGLVGGFVLVGRLVVGRGSLLGRRSRRRRSASSSPSALPSPREPGSPSPLPPRRRRRPPRRRRRRRGDPVSSLSSALDSSSPSALDSSSPSDSSSSSSLSSSPASALSAVSAVVADASVPASSVGGIVGGRRLGEGSVGVASTTGAWSSTAWENTALGAPTWVGSVATGPASCRHRPAGTASSAGPSAVKAVGASSAVRAVRISSRASTARVPRAGRSAPRWPAEASGAASGRARPPPSWSPACAGSGRYRRRSPSWPACERSSSRAGALRRPSGLSRRLLSGGRRRLGRGRPPRSATGVGSAVMAGAVSVGCLAGSGSAGRPTGGPAWRVAARRRRRGGGVPPDVRGLIGRRTAAVLSFVSGSLSSIRTPSGAQMHLMSVATAVRTASRKACGVDGQAPNLPRSGEPWCGRSSR